jgi:uncharacterized membrane protein YoaK (UPF0700 family)
MNLTSRQQVTTLVAMALTFTSGAMDVASFTRLGDVFASVMTGNMVLLGLAAARESLSLALHTLVAIAGYVVGVVVGSRITVGAVDMGERDDGDNPSGGAVAGTLPAHVNWALLAELALLAVLAAGWEAAGASPTGWAQFCLLAVAAAAMGVQSSAVRQMGIADVSTTYLTGTLTGLVSSLTSRHHATPDRPRRVGVLLGLVAGASLSGLLIATAPDGVPALPLAALGVALLLSMKLAGPDATPAFVRRARRPRDPRARRDGQPRHAARTRS